MAIIFFFFAAKISKHNFWRHQLYFAAACWWLNSSRFLWRNFFLLLQYPDIRPDTGYPLLEISWISGIRIKNIWPNPSNPFNPYTKVTGCLFVCLFLYVCLYQRISLTSEPIGSREGL